jgi:CO/xanthine dehydrogenase FAD-binding subunit
LLALDAEARVVGPSGERSRPLDGFFVDFLATELEPDEILTSVWVPTNACSLGQCL